MKVITALEEIPDQSKPVAVALGNFDGVHLGHQEIINQLVGKAKSLRMPSVVFSFHPHPLQILGNSPLFLSMPEEKECLINQLNVDYFLKFPFNKQISEMSAEDFFYKILFHGLKAQSIFVGFNFSFGKNALGNVDLLASLCRKNCCELNIIPEIFINGITVSSTNIRKFLLSGKIKEANEFLGYAYNISGLVIDGQKKGREIGFPTANLKTSEEIVIPSQGVYAVEILIDQKWYHGVANIGIRPTMGNNLPKSIEVHILDQNLDLYHQEMRVFFIEYIRAEKKFSDLTALMYQIQQDISRARDILANKSPSEICSIRSQN